MDHWAWTAYQNLPPLDASMNLKDYCDQFKKIPQMHFVGTDDRVIPPFLVRQFVGEAALVVEIEGASHNDGWEKIYPLIWNEK